MSPSSWQDKTILFDKNSQNSKKLTKTTPKKITKKISQPLPSPIHKRSSFKKTDPHSLSTDPVSPTWTCLKWSSSSKAKWKNSTTSKSKTSSFYKTSTRFWKRKSTESTGPELLNWWMKVLPKKTNCPLPTWFLKSRT
jgi:hypothetical protein